MAIHFLGPDRADGVYPSIPADSPFWTVVDFVDHEVDLGLFEARYERLGRSAPPYDPRLMLVAWLWCAAHDGCSPSKAARRCRQDTVLTAWFGDRVPDRTTLRQFLVAHRQAWQTLLPAVVAVSARLGLVDATVTATDGSVFSTPGSLRQARPLWWLRWQIREVSEQLDDEQRRCAALHAHSPAEQILDDVSGASLTRQRTLQRRLARLQAAVSQCLCQSDASDDAAAETLAARRQYLHQWLERQEAAAARLAEDQQRRYDHDQQTRAHTRRRGTPAVPPHQCRHVQQAQQRAQRTRDKLRALDATAPQRVNPSRNPADPTARTLKGKTQTRWVYGDDAICTVDRHQNILALRCYGTASDQGTLHRNLAAARDCLHQAGVDQHIRLNLADAGFASHTALTTPTEGLCLINVPDTAPNGTPWTDPAFQTMLKRLHNPAGQRLYHRRMTMIEPVFAHLTCHAGRQLHFRSPTRATELTILATNHNLAKLAKHCHHTHADPYPTTQPLKTLTIRKHQTKPAPRTP